jgi:hypothetical protein
VSKSHRDGCIRTRRAWVAKSKEWVALSEGWVAVVKGKDDHVTEILILYTK